VGAGYVERRRICHRQLRFVADNAIGKNKDLFIASCTLEPSWRQRLHHRQRAAEVLAERRREPEGHQHAADHRRRPHRRVNSNSSQHSSPGRLRRGFFPHDADRLDFDVSGAARRSLATHSAGLASSIQRSQSIKRALAHAASRRTRAGSESPSLATVLNLPKSEISKRVNCHIQRHLRRPHRERQAASPLGKFGAQVRRTRNTLAPRRRYSSANRQKYTKARSFSRRARRSSPASSTAAKRVPAPAAPSACSAQTSAP
jgi:hypothetical protein